MKEKRAARTMMLRRRPEHTHTHAQKNANGFPNLIIVIIVGVIIDTAHHHHKKTTTMA